MAVKRSALIVPLFFLASVAMGGVPPVEVEMLEFMGEFETSAGKPVDPAQFAKEGETPQRKDVNSSSVTTQKKGTPVRKEKEDEKNLHR